jgi:hypothetical protein
MRLQRNATCAAVGSICMVKVADVLQVSAEECGRKSAGGSSQNERRLLLGGTETSLSL